MTLFSVIMHVCVFANAHALRCDDYRIDHNMTFRDCAFVALDNTPDNSRNVIRVRRRNVYTHVTYSCDAE